MTQDVTQTLGYSLPEEEDDPIWARLCPSSCCAGTYGMIDLEKDKVTFGRDLERCDVDFPSPQVSSVHAKIVRNVDYCDGAYLAVLYDLSTNGTFVNGAKIGKKNSKMVYEGDVIMFQTSSNDKIDRQIKKVRKEISFILYRNRSLDEISSDSIFSKYDLRDQLGTGSFATVKLGIDRETGQRMAVKVIDKKKFELKNTKNNKASITQESDIMQQIEHENIIKIHDVFDEEDSLYIVLEMATGGELFDRIVKHKRLKEDIARNVMKQLLSAVMYLHGMKLAHRDLKPENILMKSNDPNDWTVKITDFGLSRYMSEQQRLTTMCGTPMFLAPEVLHSRRRGGYDLAVDYWSLGVILYLMLVGHPPYKQHANNGGKQLLEDVKKGRFSFPEASWRSVSSSGKDLVQKLMCLDVAKRYDGPHVLAHRWMRPRDSSSSNASSLTGRMKSHSLTISGKKRRYQFGADDDCKVKDTLNGHRNLNGHRMEGVPPRKRYKTGDGRDDRMSCDSVGSENPVRVDSACGYTPKGRGKI